VSEATTGDSILDANRGALVMNGSLYFVNGDRLFRRNTDTSVVNLGEISLRGRVSMATNGRQLMIVVPGTKGYIFTESPDTLTEITTPGFTANGNATGVVFIDSYFLCTTDENKFILSDPNDGLVWSALDFGSAESSPDDIVYPLVWRNQLFIGGERTIEAFTNTGIGDNPFQRSGLFIQQGVLARFSMVVADSTYLWVGADNDAAPRVFAFQGNEGVPISTPAVDDLLQSLSDTELSEVYAWSYGQFGHYFVGFVLPQTCLVYDTTTGLWAERCSRVNNGDGTFSSLPYRASTMSSIGGNVYATDILDGRVGRLDPDVYTEYGERVERVFATQPFQNNMQPFFVPKLELTAESGVGNAAEPDPKIRLKISRDGGKTWGNERERAMGKVGEYTRRAIWRRNGRTTRFDVYRFSMAAPVKFVVIQLTAQIEVNSAAA